jgi:uncharacterized protein
MNAGKIAEAVKMGTQTGHVLIATADWAGIPHIAVAGRIALEGDSVVVTEWFCPGTVANLRPNVGVSIVAWDKASDTGYQLIGRLQTSSDVAVLNGYAPGLDGERPLPQVERRLVIRVERVMDFRFGPHSDAEQ